MLAVDSCNVHVYIFSSHNISSFVYFQHNWKTKQRNGDAGKRAAFRFKVFTMFRDGNTCIFFFPFFFHTSTDT